MTNEEKELVLKDILGRLPYGLKAQVWSYWNGDYFDDKLDGIDLDEGAVLDVALPGGRCEIEKVKPYLRPMGSMTEEEKEEYEDLDYLIRYATNSIYASERLLDFCNSHYLDYHGLIGRGLALEAPQGMYNKMKE